MTERLSPTVNLTAVEATTLSAHRVATVLQHGNVRAVSAGIDVKAVANTEIALGGAGTEHFCLSDISFMLTAIGAPALNGNCTVQIGTSVGGAEIAAAAPLTNLIALNSTFRWSFIGQMPTILSNASIWIRVTIADTSAGTGTMVAYVAGDTF